VEGATAPASFELDDLFRTEASTIFGFLLLRCGSRAVAEDLTGETFVHASRRYAAGRGCEVTPAWLVTVARRRLIDHWRSVSAHERRVLRLAREPLPPEPPLADPDDRVDRALGSLSDRQRAALVLRYLDEFSVSEVAQALDLSYKATESLLSRGRRAFAIAYGESADA
jgi:RNA polymerase sigma-70 factor (ECF subfamily)